jgi:hypothetical protein
MQGNMVLFQAKWHVGITLAEECQEFSRAAVALKANCLAAEELNRGEYKKRIMNAIIIIAMATVAFGQSPPIAQNQLTSAEQLKEMGFDPEKVYGFLAQLQKAIAANDRQTLGSMINYPLNVIAGEHRSKLRSKSVFLKKYDEVFTPKVKSAITEQRPEQLFIKSTGFMIGQGELWFDEINGCFKIVTVQPH